MNETVRKSSVKSVCPYCGVGCGIVMDVVANKVVRVSGDREHPANFGRLCTKGSTCHQAIDGPGRMEKAHMRRADGHEQVPVSIDFAISQTARRLRSILDEHGPDAISLYVSGQMSLEAQYLANKLAKGFIRTRHIESNSRLCMASAASGYKLSLGSDGPPGSYEDFDRADLFFVIGANMADCHPILYLRMMDRVKAGARLIVVDPRRTTTADKAHLFLQIRPGTDLALLNGLLHLIVKNDRTAPDFIASYTRGWEVMPEFLAEYPPERVAEITGLSEADIIKAAEWIGDAPEWMSCWTMGLNQSAHGTWNTNAVCNLHLATGKICRKGSGPFSLTGQPNAMGGREMGYMGPGLPGQRSLLVEEDRIFVEDMWGVARGTLRQEAGSGTVAMFEEMKSGAIKACWIICTNPVATVANRQTVIDALKAAELVITQDAFLDTETNIYADIMLPGALWAEAEGVMVNSERNMMLTRKAVEPPGDALPDWQIIARIASGMGFADAFTYTSAAEVFEEIARAWNPKTGYDIRGASYERLRHTPLQWPVASPTADARNPVRYLNDGVSSGKLEAAGVRHPALAFATEDGKACFFPRPHMEPAEMPDTDFPFILNTGRLQHQWHTMTKTGKVPALNKLNPEPFVEINPSDATVLGIQQNDRVEIRSRRGKALLPAVVTDRVRPGDCFVPFHWNDVFGDDLAINAVTADAVDETSLQPGFKFCAVSLVRVPDDARAVQKKKTSEPQMERIPVSVAEAISLSPAIAALSSFAGVGPLSSLELEQHEKLYFQGFLTGLGASPSTPEGQVPVLPVSAPVDERKRLMLDGLLAGLYSRSATGAAVAEISRPLAKPEQGKPDEARRITLLWASQTGNAETVAEESVRRFTADGYDVRRLPLDAMSRSELMAETRVLFVVSTFGDGDPPDNGMGFWDMLQRQDMPHLPDLHYGVLAFGDSSYDRFCGFGRALDARLESLGAQRMAERVECEPDDDKGPDTWRNAIVSALSQSAIVTEPAEMPTSAGMVAVAGDISPPALLQEERKPVFNRKNPYTSRLRYNRLLSQPGSSKEIRQFVLDLDPTEISYVAGDALGVWPQNCPQLVAEVIDALGFLPEAPVSVEGQGELPLAKALAQHYEIARATPDFLRWWCERSRHSELSAMLAGASRETVTNWLWGRQIADILTLSPVRTTVEDFIGALKRLQPRLYSISSSARLHPLEVHLTVSAVRYAGEGQKRKGVASSFLADRAEGVEVPVFIQPSTHFRVPQDADTAMIMIGPGTGIAPFRAFLQEREAIGAKGKNWLFFGEQHAASDFYYRDELEAWSRSGHLTRLDTAFSRDQEQKVYVQHRMIEQGSEIWRWLEEGAHVYVCGDATKMARDVEAALVGIVQDHGAMSTERAREYVSALSSSRRYVRDVY